MTLQELHDSLVTLLEDKGKAEDAVCVEVNGTCYELKSISVIVQSDLWVPDTVVASVEEIISEDEV